MNRSTVNALKSMTVLLCIAAVCTALLTVCNMFFPTYVPTLDASTAALINTICPTGVSDGEAYDGGYIVMLSDEEYGVVLADYNNANKQSKAQILAVYGEPKGINTGAYVVESASDGRDGTITLLIAYKDGSVLGATVKKQGESYWNKLPDDLFASINGSVGEVDLLSEWGKTGATVSLTAINRAVNLSNAFASEYNLDIREVISVRSKEAVTND